MKKLHIVLVTEHTLFRAGLRAVLDRMEGVRVVGETGSGREAVAMAKTLHPSVVLIEPELAEMGGIEAAAQILHFSPDSRVVLLSTRGDRRAESRALKMGASAILPRSANARELESLLRDAPGDGERAAHSPSSSRRPQAPPRRTGKTRQLTPRQLEVLKMLSEGSGVKMIAQQLGISPKTVETHRSQLMERLHIYDLVGLVRFALKEQITRL